MSRPTFGRWWLCTKSPDLDSLERLVQYRERSTAVLHATFGSDLICRTRTKFSGQEGWLAPPLLI
jgi:hypothetical protein